MRKTACLAILMALSLPSALVAAGSQGPFGFVAWNPGAVLSFFPTDFITRSILPTALFNQEAGVALAGGFYGNQQVWEVRFCVGNSNGYYFVAQTQVGWSWFFGETVGWLDKGPYLGSSLRYWDLVQVHSGIQLHNLAPMIHIGWWLDFGVWFADFRLSQVFAVASLSSLAHSTPGFAFVFSPMPGISPVMPIGLIQIGMKL